jgi:hypothetical protein
MTAEKLSTRRVGYFTLAVLAAIAAPGSDLLLDWGRKTRELSRGLSQPKPAEFSKKPLPSSFKPVDAKGIACPDS